MGDETVLITGASSGIGLELTRLFAAAGSDLVLVARREERLAALADELGANDVTVRVLPADLSMPTSASAICEILLGSGVDIDILVNNAGFGARGAVVDLSIDRQIEMMQVNMRTLTELTRRLLPGMVQRGWGGILNVASTAAFQPGGPYMAVYYASKAYVLSFTEGLAEELAGTGIDVTCLAPGPTSTEFGAIADVDESILFKAGTMEASKAAWAGYRGLRRGKTLVVPGLRNKLTTLAVRLLPRPAIRKIVARLQR
jgi:short-subunit dehydrogenase